MINAKTDLMIRNSEKIDKIESICTINILKKCAALNLTLKDKDVDVDKVIACKKLVKSKCHLFSYFRNNNLLNTAIFLSLEDNPEEALNILLNIHKKLKDKFKSSEFLPLAAEVIFNAKSNINIDEAINKSKEAYDYMKSNHFFLTGSEDVSAAAMLAINSNNLKETFKEIELCYKTLKYNYFSPGDNLQTLSHILSLFPGTVEEKCKNVIELDKALRNNKVPLKSYSLPLLGIAQLITDDYNELAKNISETDNILRKHSGFGSLSLGSSKRHMISTSLVCSTYFNTMDYNLKNTMTNTTNTAIINIVTIMQIVAASAAATAAAASAASSSSN